jgi:LacI family transcriptional regulator
MARRKKRSDQVTIIDVAREANVSYSTVSRVVNNKSYVKPETRQRVLEAMDQLGYQANLQARSLAGGRSNVIGLLVHGTISQYTGEIIRGIDDVLVPARYEMMLYTSHHGQIKEVEQINMMARGLADGLLLLLPLNPEQYLDSLRRQSFPYVLIDQKGDSTKDASVTAASREGTYKAIRYLIELGHRRIGFIAGTLEIAVAMERLEAYKQALSDYRIPLDPQLVKEGDFLQPSGFAGGNALLSLPTPPTAIFASSDMMALGVMDAARTHGLRIPEDLSLIGFDDIPMAAVAHPGLTTVRQPLEEIGRIATEILLRAIENPEDPPEVVVVPTELIIRGTTAPVKLLETKQEAALDSLRR